MKLIKEAFSSFFKDIYAFNEVVKKPPQPSFDKEYHKNTNMYHFYHKLKLMNLLKFCKNIKHNVIQIIKNYYYAHGGYDWGDNGFWNNNSCVIS